MISLAIALLMLSLSNLSGQTRNDVKTYHVGIKTFKLIDTGRTYKINSPESDSLHFRPVEVDIWYPSLTKGSKKIVFRDLFALMEQRANRYQDGEDYTGITDELAQFYAIELGLGPDGGNKLLGTETNSYSNLISSNEAFPLIIYMAGLNGMGFENFKILERLAEKGFIVASIWSVGRYPGNMTNDRLDMIEQVYDAEFAIDYLKSQSELSINFDNTGILACSWGGMSAAVLSNRNPEIQTMVSLDGTETHYFGESDEDDAFIREIHNLGLLNPENSTVNYLYLESGNKLEEFVPTEEYNYYKKLNSQNKYYIRFANSKHEDFTSLPSVLGVTRNAIDVHEQIAEGTILFFEDILKNGDRFKSYYHRQSLSDNIFHKPIEGHIKSADNTALVGKIQDGASGLPLAYVSIGIPNKDIGTVSNTAGNFELDINPEMEDDTLRVSMIGYQPKSFSMNELLSHRWDVIELDEEVNQLTEIEIVAPALKQKNLGNKTTSRFVSTGFGYNQLGAEMGIKINVRKPPVFVDNFNFHISYNRLSARAIFRLNIYEVEGGKPSKNIIRENIIIPIEPKQTGIISVDLKEYNIVLRDDVIATLEWVKIEGENKKGEAIFFSLGVFSSGTFIKRSSQGEFRKHSNMGVGMNLDVRY